MYFMRNELKKLVHKGPHVVMTWGFFYMENYNTERSIHACFKIARVSQTQSSLLCIGTIVYFQVAKFFSIQ